MQVKLKNKIIDGGFLQSEDWIDFQKAFGKNVFKIKKNDCSANAIENKLPIVGNYLFVPRGPILSGDKGREDCLEELVKKAKKAKSVWVRVEPQTKADLERVREFARKKSLKLLKSKKDHQPAQTLMLELESSKEEQLLAQMKSKTRYNINLAKRRGVEVKISRSAEAIDSFIKLSVETAKRDGIAIHPESYYRRMLGEISSPKLELFTASFKGEVIATALVSFLGEVATYLHGASSNKHRNVMAPYLLQWSAITHAKRNGYKRYDFGGTKVEFDENNKLKQNSWSGITRFKVGFCPKNKPVEFPGCWDIVIDKKKYYTYKVLQNTKDILRKLKIK